MLYYLFQWLDKYDFPGAGMFGYTSFRALMAIILALLISSIWGDKFIDLLKTQTDHRDATGCQYRPVRRKQGGRTEYGRSNHYLFHSDSLLLLGKLNNIYMILMLITTVWVRFIRICRRLHQDIQERQGRPAW